MNKPQKEAKAIRRKYRKSNFTCEDLRAVVKDLGYTVIEFNNTENNEDVCNLVDALTIGEIVKHSRGFTYADKDFRLVFLNEDLNEREKCLILSHEIGHILCGHCSCSPVIGNDVTDEDEANRFSFSLMNPGFGQKAAVSIRNHKKAVATFLCIVLVASVVAASVCVCSYNSQFYGDYYVTETGCKYHDKNCKYVKNKTNVVRLTKEQYESGEYSACKVCLPDE